MAKATATVATQKIVLRIPESLYDTFAERGMKHGREAEEEILLRLRNCRDYTATSPLYVNDDQRNELSLIAGQTIRTPEELLAWARRISSINVSGTTVDLSSQLLTRLETRRFGKPMSEHMKQVVTEQLESYAGMR